jgi:hypothetical protein
MTSRLNLKSRYAAALGVLILTLAACAAAATAPAANPVFGPATDNTGKSFSGGGVAAPASAPAPAAAQSNLTDTQLIVRTGTMTLIVKDVPAAVTAARAAIVALGGYVSGDSAQGGDSPSAEGVYRIPVARFEDAKAAMRALAIRVVAEQSSSSDVTSQVVDLGARLDNLAVTEKALQAIMDKAVKIQDVLDVQTQLTDVRSQIEQLTAQKTLLANQAALSTLTVDFGLDVPATTVTSQGWNPGQIIDGATATLLGIGQGLAGASIVFIIVGLPILLGLGILALLVLMVIRLARRMRRRPVQPETTGLQPPPLT